MKQFKKLGREEMRQVKAGSTGPCQVGRSCAWWTGPDGAENGNCAIQNSVCLCVNANGDSGADPTCGGSF